MKRLVATMALVFASVLTASAITISTNATPLMVVPPVINPQQGAVQYSERSYSNTVAQGELRRVSGVLCIAANAGTTTNALVTTVVTNTAASTTYATNAMGYVVTNVTALVTSTNTSLPALSVPLTGWTGYDGTVRWLRVPLTRAPVIVQARIVSPGAVVTVTDSDGGTVQLATDYSRELFTGSKALYARYDSTNGVSGASLNIVEQ